MANCLIDYIGILGCGAVTPPSGFYLNSLPGITIKSIEALADSEKKTFLGVWENIQTRSSRRFISEVSKAFAKRYRIKNITQSLDLGKTIDTTATVAPAAEYRGALFNLDKWYDNTEFEASALQSHYLQAAYFYADGAQTSTLRVFDYDLNTQIDSISFTSVAGWNTIPIHSSYEERRIVVAVDSTAFTTVSLTLPESIKTCYECGAFVQGAKVTIGDDLANTELSANTHGLSLIYGVRCKYDSLVCNNLENFTMAYAYMLGSELMMERLASNVISAYTVNLEQANELKAYYDDKFESELELAVSGIDLSTCDCCLECDPPLAIRESIQ